MTTKSAHREAARLLDHLQRHCLLVNVTFHRWTGRAIVRGADVELAGTALDGSQVTPPRWRLVPPNLKRAVDRIQSRTRAELDRISVPFPIKGVHVVPMERAGELFRRLRNLREDLDDTADELVLQKYDDLVAEIRERLGEQVFAEAREYIPDRMTLRSRFGLEWGVFALELRPPGSAQGVATELLGEADRQFGRTLVQGVERLIRRPRGELAAALDNLAARLEGGGTTRGGTLDQVRRAYAKVRAFRFLADEDLLATIDRLDRKIGKLDPREVNRAEQEWADGLAKMLRQAAAVASDETAIRSTLREVRGLRVRGRDLGSKATEAAESKKEPEPVAT